MATTFSPFSSLYYQIMQRVKSEVPDIVWIDQDLGQLEDDRPAVSFPCLLIDLDNFQASALSGNIQIMEGEVVLRLAFEAWSQTNSTTPDAWREKGLAYYELEWELNRALMGWDAEGFSALIRTSASTEKREDNIRVRQIRYSVSFHDYSAEPAAQRLGDFMLDFTDDFNQQNFGTVRPNLVVTT